MVSCGETSCSNQIKKNRKVVIKPTLKKVPFEAEKKKALKAYFDKLAQYGGFNGNVLIAQNDKVIFEQSYGYASFRPKKKLDTLSSFKIGSVSKQFTAMAILQLYEQGCLSLQDTVQRFFPDFPYKDINVHDLLCHRSGLMNYIYFCENSGLYDSLSIDNQDVIQLLTDSFPTRYYPPKRRFDYSNTGYMLLAGIVEKVSGMRFPDYMQKNIFTPLNMKSSYIFDVNHLKEDSCLVTSYARRYVENPPDYLDGVYGDKGVCTTAKDLFLWEQALFDYQLISDTTLHLAFGNHGKSKRAKINYGYGWRVFQYKSDIRVAYHAGWWHSYRSLLVHSEKDRTSIIVLENKQKGRMPKRDILLDILYKQY